jgi:hypothetical protein
MFEIWLARHQLVRSSAYKTARVYQTLTDDGVLFQTWHQIRVQKLMVINPEPTLTSTIELIAYFEQGHLEARMNWLGSWTSLPQRIGSSTALDRSIHLMVSTHTAMLHAYAVYLLSDCMARRRNIYSD